MPSASSRDPCPRVAVVEEQPGVEVVREVHLEQQSRLADDARSRPCRATRSYCALPRCRSRRLRNTARAPRRGSPAPRRARPRAAPTPSTGRCRAAARTRRCGPSACPCRARHRCRRRWRPRSRAGRRRRRGSSRRRSGAPTSRSASPSCAAGSRTRRRRGRGARRGRRRPLRRRLAGGPERFAPARPLGSARHREHRHLCVAPLPAAELGRALRLEPQAAAARPGSGETTASRQPAKLLRGRRSRAGCRARAARRAARAAGPTAGWWRSDRRARRRPASAAGRLGVRAGLG